MIKYLIVLCLISTIVTATELEYYDSIVPGIPAGSNKVIGGLYKKSRHTCIVRPVEDTKAKLVTQGHDRFQKGVSIALFAFIISLAFKNSIVHSISSILIGLGGFLCLDGLLKIFMAQYLVFFCWAAFLVIVIGIILKYRKSSIFNLKSWIVEKKAAKKSYKRY